MLFIAYKHRIKMKENLKAWEVVKAIEEGKKLQMGLDGMPYHLRKI